MMLSRPNRRAYKEILRDEANDRQAKHDERTPEQQLALIDKRPGESLRERARLEPLMEPKPKRRRAKRAAKKVTAQSIREKTS